MDDLRISTADHDAASHDLALGDRHEGNAADIGAHQPLPLSQNADVAAFEVAQAEEQQANGKTGRLAANEPQNAATPAPVQIVPDQGNVVHLPPNTSIDDIHVEGRNLVLIQADGTRIVIINGALHVPTFLIGEVTLPQQAVVAALQQQGINVAEGPDGSVQAGNNTDSGHQFTDSQAANARTPLNLIGLLGPGDVIGSGSGGPATQDNNRGSAQVAQTEQPVAPLTAAADTGSLQSGATTSSDAAHGVLANDVTTVGGLQVVGVTAGSATAAQSANVDSAIATALGTLTLHADGSYSYHANPNGSGTDTFTYTVRDANGTLSTTTLTFTVTDGRTSQPETIDPTKLSEANLPGGTVPSEAAVAAQGSITLADPDTPHITSVLDANGTSVTVGASGTTTVQGSYGTLSIDADGKYSYTLTTAGVHAGGEQETFTYTVTDAHGNITTSTLSFTIADDAPVAAADTGSLQSGVPASADAAHGVLVNDVTGADGDLQVVGVTAGSTQTAQSDHVGSAIVTTLGTLTLNADGSYSYHANPNESGTDTFTYTIKDADGSLSTTTLTFTVTDGRTSQPETIDPTKLSEANLPNGTTPSETAVTAHGSIALADPDAPHITGVTNSHGDVATVDAKSGDWQIQGSYGILTIGADGKYSYTLTTAALHAGGEQETFTYTVTDQYGNVTTSTLSFTIANDVPVADLGATGTVYEASLPEGEGGKGISATAIGSLNVTWGADGAASSNSDGHQAVVFSNESVSVSGEAGAVLTSHGLVVHTTVLADGTLIGFTGDSVASTTDANVVFYSTLSDSGKGSYSFTLVQALDHASGAAPLTLTFDYTATDADGDSASNSFTISVVDDVPVAGASIADQTLTEHDLISESGSLVSGGMSTGEVALNFSFGADGPAKTAVTFVNQIAASNITLTDGAGHVLDLSHLTSGGNVLQYALSSDSTTLTAYYLSDGKEVTVFTVVLSENGTQTGGAYDFTLCRPLSDSDATDFQLSFAVVGHDGDGDTTAASQSFAVDIHSDIPTANNWSLTTNAAPGETITIPTAALLWEAFGAHHADLSIAAIMGSVANLNGDSVTIAVSGHAESFDYTVTDGIHQTVATVSIDGHWTTTGTAANEIFVAAHSGDGYTIIGGLGNDVLIGSADTAENILYGDGTSETTQDGNDLLIGGVNSTNIMYGGGGDDTLIGAEHALNEMYGGSGNNTLIGASNATNDMHGGSGNDFLSGGDYATNTMDGGDGDNTFVAGLFSVNTMIGGSGNDTFKLIENSFNTVVGGGGNNTLDFSRFNHGIEITLAHSSTATHFDISGGGLDYSDISGIIGTPYDDVIIGSDHSDYLFGGAGNDVLIGGAGNDTLDGGSGFNVMTGGAGADTFMIDAAALNKLDPADIITDFRPAAEGDVLDVTGLIDALIKQDGLSQANALNHLTAVVDDKTNTTTISVQTATETHAVVTLQNFAPDSAGVKILYNHDEHALATSHTG
jgi:T1SS-143 domain-containing protein